VIGVSFFEELAQNRALVERLALVLQRGYETAWVQIQEGLRFVVWVHFDVLVQDAFLFERDPDALDKGAEPARVEFQVMLSRVCLESVTDMRIG
jgi:hypothetical protein